MLSKKPTVEAPLKKSDLGSVMYTTLTEETFKRFCAMEITEPYQYKSDPKNTPFDLRLGTIDNGVLCETCRHDSVNCSGHYGYITIEHPVINPVFSSYVNDLLKCVCYNCSNLLISEGEQERLYKNDGTTLTLAKARCKLVKECFFCKESCDEKGPLTTHQILAIFKKITNKSLKILGFNKKNVDKTIVGDEKLWKDPALDDIFHTRPESWIFDKIFPVIPPQARPYVITEGERKEDVLTTAYGNLIKITKTIRDIRNQTTEKKRTKKTEAKCIAEQEKIITMIIDNKSQNKALSGERKITSLAERLSGKKGHMQNNIGGKRVNQSARTVIDSAGHHLKINEIGIPRYVANILTIPEIVTRTNIEYLNSLLLFEDFFCEDCKTTISKDHAKKKDCASKIRKQLELSFISLTTKMESRSNNANDLELTISIEREMYAYNQLKISLINSNHSECTVTRKYRKGKVANVIRKGNIINVEKATNGFTIPFCWNGVEGLQEKDIINRHLITHDPNLAGRQPSIRTESMMGFRIRIHDNLVFEIPLAVTKPFNADFDGDEMNIHVPQTIAAQSEAIHLMGVSTNIITRQSNAPIIGAVQNTLVSMYLLSLNLIPFSDFSYIISKFDFSRIECLARRCYEYPEYRKYIQRYNDTYFFVSDKYSTNEGFVSNNGNISGKILASIVFPSTFCYKRKTGLSEERPWFVVEKGVVLPNSGPICKKVIGITKGSTIHYLWKKPYSPEICMEYISELQYVGLMYISTRGFSFGINDCVPTDNELYKNALEKAYEEELECGDDYDKIVEIRARVRELKGVVPDFIEDTLKKAYIECENINASSKPADEKEALVNSTLNATLGSSAILAKKYMNKSASNSLVIMKVSGAKGTDVNNGQISGFAGQQNLDGGRMKKALSTSTGTRCLPTFKANDDGPAARGFIDRSLLSGLTPSQAFCFAQTGRQGNVDTAVKTAITGYIQKMIATKCGDAVQRNDGTVRDASSSIIQFLYGNDGFNPKKLLTIRYKNVDIPFFTDVSCLATYLNVKAEEEGEDTSVKRKLFGEEIDHISKNCFGEIRVKTDSTFSSMKMISTVLSAKLSEIEIYENKIVELFNHIKLAYKDAINETGESVGLIAACSIGEPTTQMTLNTHQFVGVSEKEVVGVTRLNELLRTTMKPSNPTMSIYLAPLSENKKTANERTLENLTKMLSDRGITFSYPFSSDKLYVENTRIITGDIVVLFLHLYDLNNDAIRVVMETLITTSKKHIIIIYRGKITPTAKKTVFEMKKEYRIELFSEKEMQYDPTAHYLVPKHIILSKEEKEKIYNTYAIKNSNMLPSISCEDPIVRRIGAVKGNLLKIIRKDLVIPDGEEVFYRIVIGEIAKKKK
jgi:DNA-directed RNA polymerase III subunit RPC1